MPRQQPPTPLALAALAPAVLTAACSLALAQPDFGFDWRTVGDAGNRNLLPSEAPAWPSDYRLSGAVDHEYRMMTTEVTNAQFLDFMNAWGPTAGFPTDRFVIGSFIRFDASSQTYGLASPAVAQWPVGVRWESAARFTNWLHNDRGTDPSDFERGVYDTSTFIINPDFTIQHEAEPAPGARVRLPTLDEWIKPMHWGPDKNGPGEGGYWMTPGSQDEPLIGGLPSDPLAQTNFFDPDFVPGGNAIAGMDVGSYPDTQSPWGLLDGSGGGSEWTTTAPDLPGRGRVGIFADGSAFAAGGNPVFDSPGSFGGGLPILPLAFRLAAPIPSPPTAAICIGFLIASQRRRPAPSGAGPAARLSTRR